MDIQEYIFPMSSARETGGDDVPMDGPAFSLFFPPTYLSRKKDSLLMLCELKPQRLRLRRAIFISFPGNLLHTERERWLPLHRVNLPSILMWVGTEKEKIDHPLSTLTSNKNPPPPPEGNHNVRPIYFEFY